MRPWEKYSAGGKPWEKYNSQGPSRPIEPWQQAQMVHPAQPMTREQQIQADLAGQAGLPLSGVDFAQGNLNPLQRGSLGFLSDTPAEQRAWLEQQYPGSQIFESNGTMGVLPPGADQMLVPNPPGFEPLGSTAEFLGRTGPGIAGGTGGAALGVAGGLPGSIGGAMAGVAGAEGLREGTQYLVGTQRETGGELLGRIGLDTALELIPGVGAGMRGIRNLLTRRGATEFSRVMQGVGTNDFLALMKELEDAGELTLPALKNFQKSDNPVLRRISSQALQFSEKGQQRLVDQANQLVRMAQQSAEALGERSVDDVAQTLEAERLFRTEQMLKGSPVDTTEAGKAIEGAVSSTLNRRKAAMQTEYGKLDALVERYQPVYNIEVAQNAARQRIVRGSIPPPSDEELQALGGALPEDWVGWINVADPNRKLSRINYVLSQLTPEQNYGAVKELRSRTGQLLNLSPEKLRESNVNLGQIKDVYGELSRALDDPLDVTEDAAKALRAQNQTATREAVRYHDTYHLPEVRQALRSAEEGRATRLYTTMAKDPATWGPEIRAVIEEGSPAQRDRLKTALTHTIMRSDDPLQTLRGWQETNPRAFEWLYPNEASRRNSLETAKRLNDLNSSAARAADDAAFEQVGFAQKAIQEHMGKRYARGSDGVAQARAMVRQYGGPGSEGHQSLRKALYGDALEKAIAHHEDTANLVLDPKILAAEIQEMKKSGVWEGVLTEMDRKKLTVMQRYAKETSKKGDAGTGLAVASQVGQLRHGDPSAIVSAFASRRMADWLTREDIPGELLFTRLRDSRNWIGNSAVARLVRQIAPTTKRAIGQGLAADYYLNESPSTRPTGAGSLPPELPLGPP